MVQSVRTEIVVAIIGAIGLAVQVLANVIVARQSANDELTNIDRKIELARKLNPAADDRKKLEEHIARSIDKIVERDWRRDQNRTGIGISMVLLSSGVILAALSVWVDSGVPRVMNQLVHGLLLGSAIIFALSGVAMVWVMLREIWHWGRYLWRRGDLNRQLWLNRRRDRKNRREFEDITGEKALAGKAFYRQLLDAAEPHKVAIIAKVGQEQWDAVVASGQEDTQPE